MSKLSCIIPCYNEEQSLPFFFAEIEKVEAVMAVEQGVEFENIFINDGSKDGTLALLREKCTGSKVHRYISFSRNFGKEAAMYAGFRNVTGDYVVVMDADMQDPPSLLPKMYEIIESGEYDSVATRRVTRQGEPPVRSFFAKMFYKLINAISDVDVVDGARDFRFMKRSMVDAIVSMTEYNRFSKGIFGWVGFRTYWLPYENVERVAGETKWSFWKLFKYAIDGIIGFSTAPLLVSSWLGIGLTLVSLLSIAFLVGRKLVYGDPVQGWASMTCIIVFIGGVQLFCMGILGQYLAKTYMETKRRPQYIIGESNCKNCR